jgi:Domain of unknown function (DU1801)
MAQAQNKTTQTSASVDAFIEAVPDENQKRDAKTLSALMARLSGEPPRMWGPSIVGFGRYHYRYESGREGDSCRVGFSPRSGRTVIYLVDGYRNRTAQLARLGKHKTGTACLYIKRLSDVDQAVLEEMIAASLADMRVKYPG